MNSFYSIIIPIYNELNAIPTLLNKLKSYSYNGHEIIIIDDGSNDGSTKLLAKYDFISLLRLNTNLGKGVAIRLGLTQAKHKKIIIFDGDLELNPNNISDLMILDKKKEILCVFGNRYQTLLPFKSLWDFGNYFFTIIFNFIYKTEYYDILCCAKAFYKLEINIDQLDSSKFDIDVELSARLSKNIKNIKTIKLDYNRRTKKQGKKLGFLDGWLILLRILKSI